MKAEHTRMKNDLNQAVCDANSSRKANEQNECLLSIELDKRVQELKEKDTIIESMKTEPQRNNIFLGKQSEHQLSTELQEKLEVSIFDEWETYERKIQVLRNKLKER